MSQEEEKWDFHGYIYLWNKSNKLYVQEWEME